MAIEFYIQKFLDEEWRLELEEHAELGRAAAASYRRVVSEKEAAAAAAASASSSSSDDESEDSRLDVGDVLLAVASDLSARPQLFRETFTDAFETANKVAELLVHGLSDNTTDCNCVSERSIELMVVAFRFVDEGYGG